MLWKDQRPKCFFNQILHVIFCVSDRKIESLYNLDCVLHMKGDNQESLWAPRHSLVNVDASSDKVVFMFEAHWLFFLKTSCLLEVDFQNSKKDCQMSHLAMRMYVFTRTWYCHIEGDRKTFLKNFKCDAVNSNVKFPKCNEFQLWCLNLNNFCRQAFLLNNFCSSLI